MALLHQTVTSLRNIKMFFMRGKPCNYWTFEGYFFYTPARFFLAHARLLRLARFAAQAGQ